MDAATFKALAVLYAVGSWLLIHWAFTKSPWISFATMLTASTIPMIATFVFIEHRLALNPSKQSWAFLFGDAVFLPLSGAMIALMLRHDNTSSFIFKWWWQVAAIVGGIVLGFAFRLMDKPNYTTAQYNSPSKIVHEYIAYPVLASVLIWGAPLLFTSFWGFTHHQNLIVPIFFLVGVAAWGACGARDGAVKLDTHYLHPEWSWDRMATTSP